jgi:hypothetical protein
MLCLGINVLGERSFQDMLHELSLLIGLSISELCGGKKQRNA